jgi:hypothetical protein
MEDILASIRRIVSEDDKPAEAPKPPTTESFDRTFGGDPSLTSRPAPPSRPTQAPAETDSFARFARQAVAQPRPSAAPASRPSFDRTPDTRTQGSLKDTPSKVAPFVQRPAGQDRRPADTSVTPRPISAATPKPASRPELRPASTFGAPRPEAPRAPSSGSASSRAPAAATRGLAAEREVAAFRGAVASPATETTVRTSFDKLKRGAAFDLDAKVEALLRPMLREWLDDNMPRIVERLVSAEIERLANKS